MSKHKLNELDVGSVFAERFTVVRFIGAGGMGAVYEVVDRAGSHHALKVLLPQLVGKDRARERLRTEAVALAAIASAYVVETRDAGVDGDSDTPFLLLELLEGQELSRLLEQRGRLSPETVVTHSGQIAQGLDAAHAAGVVHRDLKLDNLFVTARGIKLLDFGIAKIISQGGAPWQTTGLLGTPLYMAPEQLHREQPVSPQTDIYALAHIVYTLLVGQAYWETERATAGGLYKLFVKIMDGAVEPPSQRAAADGVALSAAFDGWFMHATAVEPGERFASAGACAAGLARALGHMSPAPSHEG